MEKKEIKKRNGRIELRNGTPFFITTEKNIEIIWVSDAHLDSKKCEREFLHKVLKENKDAYIIIGGDSVDGMQGRGDKRGTKGSVDDVLNEDDYWNQVCTTIREDLLIPYRDRIIGWNRGNHDNSIIKILEVDLLKLICKDDVFIGNFAGWFTIGTDFYKDSTRYYNIYYSHAPVTGGKRSKGMLSVDIQKGLTPSADCVITEHIHTAFIKSESVFHYNTRTGTEYKKQMWFIQTPTIKDESKGRKNGFYHEKIKQGATSIGVTLLKFSAENGNVLRMKPEFIIQND